MLATTRPLAAILFSLAIFAAPLHAAAPSAPPAPTTTWDDGEGSVYTTPRSYDEFKKSGAGEPIKPLPRAANTGNDEPLSLTWQLRIASPPQDEKAPPPQPEEGTVPGAVFGDAFGNIVLQPSVNDATMRPAFTLAPHLPDWLKESPLWLFVRVSSNVEESYFYAPFALGQTPEEREATAGAVMPTEFAIVDAEGEPVPGVRFYYPSGSLKADHFSGLRLPVYQDEILVAASIPGNLLGRSLQLNVSALICTELSCTPFRKGFALPLQSADISSEALDAPLAAAMQDYRSGPFGPQENEAARPAPPAAKDTAKVLDSALQSAQLENRLAGYLKSIEPRYHAAALEISSIWMAAVLGLVAGFILNFMPCVLPVISLKIGTLAGLGGRQSLNAASPKAAQSRRRFRVYGLFFSLGVLLWFTILFAVIGFADLIWGQVFQSQSLVLALAILLFVMALALFGLVRIPLLRIQVNEKRGLASQAFLGGLLATLLATPCSGPLLGGVLGWAVNQSLPFLGVTLLCVALGMASPFMLMVIKPGLVRFLPKPGPWTETLERVMGFVLMGTVIYLLSMLDQGRIFVVLGALLALAFAAWLWARPVAAGKSRFTLGRAFALVLLVPALYLPFADQEVDTAWQPFDAASFHGDLGKRNLLVDFTADWCINCRVMEATTLTEQRLARWGRAFDLTFVRVDLTARNPDGEALLGALGSASIPLLAIIPAHNPMNPIVLRDLVTPGQLDNALNQAFK